MANQNQKWKSRRLIVASCAILLLTVAFYLVLFSCRHDAETLRVGRDLLADYSVFVFGIAGFLITGLSVTDSFTTLKSR